MDKIRVGYPVKGWTKELIEGWNAAFDTTTPVVELDLGETGFITLFDWLSIVALIEKVLGNPQVEAFHINEKVSGPSNFIPLAEFIDIEKKLPSGRSPGDINLSNRIYKSVGFIESLGTLDILNRRSKEGKISYPGITIEDVKKHQFYAGKEGNLGVLLGLTRIQSKEDCAQFIDDRRIRDWIQAMGTRFPGSSLFETQELWRVLCHEFAVNIYEHAGIPGFISMRVVSPRDNKGAVHPWCRETYLSPYIQRLFDEKNNPGNHFLEICIGDAGKGFIETLTPAYRNYLQENIPSVNKDKVTGNIRSEDIVAFAFDELGTSKDKNDCWVTERHALNRILYITAQYGGVLTIRTGGVELIYSGEGEMFKKGPTGRGYLPTEIQKMPGIIPGAQLQVILPLVPLTSTKTVQRSSTLPIFLPSTFHTETGHIHGHLVPLLEKLDQPGPCIGKEELGRFRSACENLCKELLSKRPAVEPLILDFSQLNWTAAQFETLLHFLQNILQHRPILLVEMEPALAHEVIRLESIGAPTTLDKDLLSRHLPQEGPYYVELSEKEFLETYNRIHATVLGLDRDGKTYIFGLRNHAYEAPLLSLMEIPKSIEELCQETMWDEPLDANTLKAILNHINPMFYQNEKGQWQTVWDPMALSVEAQRVMSMHFDEVAARSRAWRGVPDEKSKFKKFKLPWQEQWRSDFLETTRILSRERQADEVAQRLIYRLQKGLAIRGKSLNDVKVLACMTAPALLLASFLHRWWPLSYDPPAVSDLGYYIMLSHPGALPALVKTGGVVIVHDIMDTGILSGKLIDALKRQGMDILCMLSLINMKTETKTTEVNSIEMGWKPKLDEAEDGFIPKHAMISVKNPGSCPPPHPNEKDTIAYWIEPRTMRPIEYTTLRRQFVRWPDPDVLRRNQRLERFDRNPGGCLFAAGHFVYGYRHFSVAIDIQELLTGEIGEEIALWIADICENLPDRTTVEWESEIGYSLEGDVTAVLMPLHSQVHYLWPRVEKILAQRGRRQPTWLLDATFFTGRGPVYRLPEQFVHQIKMAVQESVVLKQRKKEKMTKPIRILILDDAIVTSRNAEAILENINGVVRREFNRLGIKESLNEYSNPIEWIRYFCVLNQMGYGLHSLWKNLDHVGEQKIKFTFEAFAPFMGIPVYTDTDCPICRDIVRLKRLEVTCEQYGFESARQWIERRLAELQPIAMDRPGFNNPNSVNLNRGIEILQIKSDEYMDIPRPFSPAHAPTAIWRFYELMYFSYPPGDVLQSLKNARETDEEGPEVKREYERYRWAVFKWCLRKWKRLEANAAVEDFITEVKREIAQDTPLVQSLLDGCAQHVEDPAVTRLIADCIDTLAELESKRVSGDEGAKPGRIWHTINLYTALALFWLNIPRARWEDLSYESHVQGEKILLMDHLDKAAAKLDIHGPSLLRNLYRQLKRPQRHTDPKWALETIAESLYRGRDPRQSKHGRHHLLPKLISEILKGRPDNEDRLLLYSSLTLFLAALEELLHYDYELSVGTYEIKELSLQILEWLKYPVESNPEEIPRRALIEFGDALDLDGPFIQKFNRVFHEEVDALRSFLDKRVKEIGKGLLTFEYAPAKDTGRCRVLIPGYRLQMCLANLTIDPIVRFQAQHKSRIEVFRMQTGEGKEKICFHLLTNFSPLEETQRLTGQGQNLKVDRSMLEMFGAEFDPQWQAPTTAEQAEGFTAAYRIKIPSGFIPGR